MRERLAVGFGELVLEKDLPSELEGCRSLMAVGDMVSFTLLDNGIRPDLVIYDLKTERRPYASLAAKLDEMDGVSAKVSNPAGQITTELVREIALALERNVPTKLLVEGEEDLAALVCAAMAPPGSCLMYGVPGKGMALLRIDQDVSGQARSMIYSMEELN
ncbi:MAG: GTP-dependent dephospho-CoA kinase family protein [Methanomassiliicoccus sp.]|nr:GTP-dependent dephospho-CoA kinase family protein [Methanomassiliicoccus sp.]